MSADPASELPPWQWPEERWRRRIEKVRAGKRLAPAAWPNGAKAAVALSFDCDHETFELGPGGEAIGRLGWGEFGRRVGVPRVLSVLEKHDVKATFFMPAVCALIDPDEPRRILGRGHEIGMHGYIHENTSLLDAATERDLMLRAHDILAKAGDTDPVGFRASHWDLSPSTIAIVREMGLLYDSSMMADDSCYELLVDGQPSGVVEIPVDWVRDDAVYLLFNRNPPTRPYLSPDDVLKIFIRELDMAIDEGGVFEVDLHPFVIGYRSRIFILDELVRHAKARGPVWFATHAELASYVMESHAGANL
jgi:peptidoglycan/xylan/chitin deacetylase (PgdA/CDA1 family)